MKKFFGTYRRLNLIAVCLALYVVLLVHSLSRFWFNPFMMNDDGYQQLFPLNRVLDSTLYQNDLVYVAMRSYLPPLHYLVAATFTYLTKSPILAGHWVMLLQLILTCIPLFFVVRKWSGLNAALFSLLWFLHSDQLLNQFVSGLPRGWLGPAVALSLFATILESSIRAYVILLAVALLTPVGGFLGCVVYSIYVLLNSFQNGRFKIRRELLGWFLAGIVIAGAVALTISRPPEIGAMISWAEASRSPAFSKVGGRFPFLPFDHPLTEISRFGFEFLVRINGAQHLPWSPLFFLIPLVLTLITLLLGICSQRHTDGARSLITFGLAVLLSYSLSRIFAFHLYVPNRYLSLPLNLFFIVSLSCGLGWLGEYLSKKLSANASYRSFGNYAPFISAGTVLYLLLGSGLGHHATFDINLKRHDTVFDFIASNTPSSAVIAGSPTYLDPLPLLGKRSAYVTTETAHPFYKTYYQEISRRLYKVYAAYYAKNIPDLLDVVKGERITHILFNSEDFREESLKKASYNRPFDAFVRTRAQEALKESAYREIQNLTPTERAKFVVYQDSKSLLVDLALLDQYTHPSRINTSTR